MFSILLMEILFTYLMLEVIQLDLNLNQIIVNNLNKMKVEHLKQWLRCQVLFLKFSLNKETGSKKVMQFLLWRLWKCNM